MSRTYLGLLVLGTLLMAGGCLSESREKNRPDLDENALPPRPDTSGLRSRPREPAPGQHPPQPADTLLPEIAREGHPPGKALAIHKF